VGNGGTYHLQAAVAWGRGGHTFVMSRVAGDAEDGQSWTGRVGGGRGGCKGHRGRLG